MEICKVQYIHFQLGFHLEVPYIFYFYPIYNVISKTIFQIEGCDSFEKHLS
jgi:hypothetical protein